MRARDSQLSVVEKCGVCSASKFTFCRDVAEAYEEGSRSAMLQAFHHKMPSRRPICRRGELLEDIPVICHGWAACSIALSDGRRQILSFCLPGDVVSTALIFDPVSQYSIEAITDIHYRMFKRSEFKKGLLKNPVLNDQVIRACVDEEGRAHRLALDLGRRSAEERVANLILNLFDRLARRGLVRDQTMDFPLRQHQIADATGLTSVHVNKVISAFRQTGLIELSERSLTVLDLTKLRRAANI